MSSSSSTVSNNIPPIETQKEILCRLKTTLFDGDLFVLLHTNVMASHDIKDLLKHVDLLTSPSVVVSFVIEFSAFLDQLLELHKSLDHEKYEFETRVVDISKWNKQIEELQAKVKEAWVLQARADDTTQ
ncbi:unnamed protein product [Vicia faba]|uniref:Uncharacterized protein n=1 Tax=Vicia faba TaxID=3906 RepID=A0AAV1BA24_VICFA|nr:unnamed protein product [Vicia faba]